MEKYLKETKMLDFSNSQIQQLIKDRKWKDLEEFQRIKAIYNFVRDEILFGYNIDDSISASKVLADGYGQCNTKGTLTGFVYKNAPQNIFHSWVEIYFENKWYELEAFILDTKYLKNLQKINRRCTGAFCGYGVAVKDFKNPVIDFNRNNTYIQSEGINEDFGIYDSPDALLKEHHQEMSWFKSFLYRHVGRHIMNRNVNKIRKI